MDKISQFYRQTNLTLFHKILVKNTQNCQNVGDFTKTGIENRRKTKIDADYYVNSLLPSLVDDCENLMPGDFIFQQDGAPAHTARLTQDWLAVNCPEFIAKDEWPPNSPDLNPLDYHVWGAMLQKYQEHNPKPTTADELKAVLQTIWDELPQQSVEKAIIAFRKRLQLCIEAEGRHFEHLL
jgi:hypothetical protein